MIVALKNGPRYSDHAPLGVACHRRLGFDTVMRAKFDDTSLSRSRETFGASKFKVVHVTPDTPLLKVICQPHAGI